MPHDGHAHIDPASRDRRVSVAIWANAPLTVAQIVGGILSGSLAMIADAVHNLSDALSLSFWLQGEKGNGCCEFIGEPYLAPAYFGRGLSIAVQRDDLELRDGLNFALKSINAKGKFAELYLRYFPISLY